MGEFFKACWPPLAIGFLSIVGAYEVSFGFIVLTVFMYFDVTTRWVDYNRLKKIIDRYGPHEVYLRTRKSSWCQRTSTVAAFSANGYGDYAYAYYYGRGYRFWHVFPDRTFSKDCPLIDPHFWGSMITRETYVPGGVDD